MKFMTWNASGIMSSGSYLGNALKQSDIDICGVSEHWLYKKDLHFLDSIHKSYNYAAVADFDLEKPSRRKNGKGGVALFWKRSIDSKITLLNIDDDRIIGIQYQLSEFNFIFVIQVYFPSANYRIAEFESYLFKLQDLCSMYSDKGTLIIMGDFNAHKNGRVFLKGHDRRSNLLQQFLSGNNFLSVNTLPLCTGATSTFVSYSGEYTSMIDHILIQIEKIDLVSTCNVLDDDALNVSTHRPIVMHIELPYVEQIASSTAFRRRVRWRGVGHEVLDQYRDSLDQSCLNMSANSNCIRTENEINSLYSDIVSVIRSASDEFLPCSKKFNKHLKPYWDQTLKELHDLMRAKRNVWISDNRPRGNSFISYKAYKDAKRIFRQYHRRCSENYMKNLNEEIDTAAGLDSRYFWKLVNARRNKSSSNVGAEIKFHGQVFRDSQELCDQWRQYFSDLYSSNGDENFDPVYFQYVTERVRNLKRQSFSESDVVLVTELELNSTISQLSKGKACGNDSVENEHIMHSGHIFRETLMNLYNAMLRSSYIPVQMKVGIIITLHKGGSKRKDDPDSYRAITLTSCVLKLFERILLNRILSTQRPFNPLQGGFQQGMGCTMTSLLLQESVHYAKENGSKLYICFLDAKKAFDKVWHDGLLLKLYERGIDLYIWKVIVSLHANLSSYVLFRGFKSGDLSVTKGTRQGGVISPYMFLCYIDDLLNELTSCDKGLCIYGINVCCPTVADDMLLQALTIFGLICLINICVRYFHLWRLEHNALKCNVLVANETVAEYTRSNRRWTLGSEQMLETTEYKHLGIVCTKKMDMRGNAIEAASHIRRLFFGLISSCFSEHDLNPLTWKRIYETVILPKALYGCELWSNLSESTMTLLERSHRLCLKTIQNVNRYTKTSVALSLIGSTNLQCEIVKRKANFLGQLCRLNPHFAVKQVFLHRLMAQFLFKQLKFGFIMDIIRLLEDYNLGYVISDYIDT